MWRWAVTRIPPECRTKWTTRSAEKRPWPGRDGRGIMYLSNRHAAIRSAGVTGNGPEGCMCVERPSGMFRRQAVWMGRDGSGQMTTVAAHRMVRHRLLPGKRRPGTGGSTASRRTGGACTAPRCKSASTAAGRPAGNRHISIGRRLWPHAECCREIPEMRERPDGYPSK